MKLSYRKVAVISEILGLLGVIYSVYLVAESEYPVAIYALGLATFFTLVGSVVEFREVADLMKLSSRQRQDRVA